MKYNTDRAFASLERLKKSENPKMEAAKIKIENDIIPIGVLSSVIMGDWFHCLYCGGPPECRDHVIPSSMIFGRDIESSGDLPGPRVIACQPCNLSLGARFYPSLTERCMAVQSMLRNRHRKLLRMADFTKSELKEYDYGLRSHIEAHTNMREYIEQKLEWQDTPKYYKMRSEIRFFIKDKYPSNEWLNGFVKIGIND